MSGNSEFKLLSRRWRGLQVRLREWSSRRSFKTPKTWWRYPELSPDDEVCLFVAFVPDGRFSEHSLVHARAWATEGFKVILAAVTNDPGKFQLSGADDLGFASGVMVRQNAGHDFGAWAAAFVELLPVLREAALVAMVNDSLYGPLDSFRAFLHRARGTDADVIGAVESVQFARHFQSYLIFFKPRALKSVAFSRFWRGVRDVDKGIVIRRYELRMLMRLDRAGLRSSALFPVMPGDPVNPSLFGWRTLLLRGFPFVKVTTIRADPGGESTEGWASVLRSGGYDPDIVRRHLGLADEPVLR